MRPVTAKELYEVGQVRVARRIARRDAFVSLAVLTYGDRWQLPLSQPLDISQAALSYIANGKRDVSDELFAKLVEHSREVGKRLAERSKSIETESKTIIDSFLTTGPEPKLVGSGPVRAPKPAEDSEPDMSP